MSKTYTQTRTHALFLANDTTFSTSDADLVMDEMYQRYWNQFLKDRVKTVTAFVTYADGDYAKVSAAGGRQILSLNTNATTTASITGSPRIAMERDDYDAVCDDSEHTTKAAITQRWAAYKNQGDAFWHVAIFPPASGALTFEAEVLPEYTTPSGATALEGDDVDAFNVARLVAVEIMVRNGDDPADIQAVWAPLDQAVKDKFQYVIERATPLERAGKEQV